MAKPGDILLSENSVAGAVIIRMEYSDKYGPDSKIIGPSWDYEKGRWAKYSDRWVWGRQVTLIEKGRKPSNKMESVLRHSIENWESKSASIRTAAIKLAYEKPELRGELLPLIQKIAGTKFVADEAYTAAIAKAVGRAKKSLGLKGVRQNYKGTGSNVAARQLFLKPGPEFAGARWSDLWLEKTYFQLGGVMQRETKPLPYTGNLARDTKKVLEIIGEWLEAVSYTHLTLPTNREV